VTFYWNWREKAVKINFFLHLFNCPFLSVVMSVLTMSDKVLYKLDHWLTSSIKRMRMVYKNLLTCLRECPEWISQLKIEVKLSATIAIIYCCVNTAQCNIQDMWAYSKSLLLVKKLNWRIKDSESSACASAYLWFFKNHFRSSLVLELIFSYKVLLKVESSSNHDLNWSDFYISFDVWLLKND
jgi:hypothetical protein